MQHFLDEQGNIPNQMPKQATELASFLALVVDTTTKTLPITLTSIDIRCFKKDCHGLIKAELRQNNNEVHWYCPECKNEGLISNWKRTKWDYRSDDK